MAVAHDAFSESHSGTTGSASEGFFEWPHTPTGTPAGVLVFVITNADAADVSSVLYGGVTLSAVASGEAVDSANESGRCKAYHFGTKALIPTGQQTVRVNRVNNTDVMYAICFTQTEDAGSDTEPTGAVLLQGDGTLDEQAVTDGSPGTNSVRYAGIMSGLASYSDNPTTPGANSLSRGASSSWGPSIDFGARMAGGVWETTPGQGSRNVGFRATTSDDRAAVHLAIRAATTKSLALGTIAATSTPYAPTVAQTLVLDVIASGVVLYAPEVAGSGGEQALTTSTIALNATPNVPEVALTLVLEVLSAGSTLYEPTVAPGDVTLTGAFLASTAVANVPDVAQTLVLP